MSYASSQPFEHGLPESLGVLIVNLGTPDAPTTMAVRRYLAQFLSDPRVVEAPRLLWWLVLHGVILNIRPRRSAAQYRKIWTDEGSPLLVHSQNIAAGMQRLLSAQPANKVQVELAMSYGRPSIDAALDKLHERGSRRIIVLPLYPQYSGSTTGSVFDAVTAALGKRRWVPEFRFINHYHDHPAYIAAIAASIERHWQTRGRGDYLLYSFHGLPQSMLMHGDPYHCQCHKTARLVSEALDLKDDQWQLSFQSRVGREKWLEPYTDETARALGAKGLKKLDVACPGFAVDCLETLEEIEILNAGFFVAAGGGDLRYIPALNAQPSHVELLCELIGENIHGWTDISTRINEEFADEGLQSSKRRALAMGAGK